MGTGKWRTLLAVCVLALCAACAETSAQPADPAAPHVACAVPTKDPAIRENPVTRDPAVIQFVATLQERGISVKSKNPSGLVFLLVPGHVYKLSGGETFIHPYPTEARAIEEVPRAVAGVEDPRIQYIDTPHFYRCDSLIVGSHGKNKPVLRDLMSLCGPQFAGY